MGMVKILNVLAGLAAGAWIARAIRRAYRDDADQRQRALIGAMLVVLGLAAVIQSTLLLIWMVDW